MSQNILYLVSCISHPKINNNYGGYPRIHSLKQATASKCLLHWINASLT